MINSLSIESVLGEPDEVGEKWSRWRVSNGTAKFDVCHQSSGRVEVCLISSRPLLIWRGDDGLRFFRLMIGIGVIDPIEFELLHGEDKR